jgi:hypothetical protein
MCPEGPVTGHHDRCLLGLPMPQIKHCDGSHQLATARFSSNTVTVPNFQLATARFSFGPHNLNSPKLSLAFKTTELFYKITHFTLTTNGPYFTPLLLTALS